LFRCLIQTADHPRAEFGRRQQILTPLAGRIQPGNGLIKIRAHPPHQADRRHQLGHRLPQLRPGLAGTSCRAANVTFAANAPRASPDRDAASLTSSNSP